MVTVTLCIQICPTPCPAPLCTPWQTERCQLGFPGLPAHQPLVGLWSLAPPGESCAQWTEFLLGESSRSQLSGWAWPPATALLPFVTPAPGGQPHPTISCSSNTLEMSSPLITWLFFLELPGYQTLLSWLGLHSKGWDKTVTFQKVKILNLKVVILCGNPQEQMITFI